MIRSALALVVLLAGCSHTYYQFRVSEREGAWIAQTHNARIGAMASEDATTMGRMTTTMAVSTYFMLNSCYATDPSSPS